MVDGGVGSFRLAQRLARMARLSAGLFAGLLSQTGDAHGLFQTVTEWRFAAIAAVQAEPAFQFGDARLLRQKQRDKGVFRKLAEGGVIHRLLRIRSLTLRQMNSAHTQFENRSRGAWGEQLRTTGEPGQLRLF